MQCNILVGAGYRCLVQFSNSFPLHPEVMMGEFFNSRKNDTCLLLLDRTQHCYVTRRSLVVSYVIQIAAY